MASACATMQLVHKLSVCASVFVWGRSQSYTRCYSLTAAAMISATICPINDSYIGAVLRGDSSWSALLAGKAERERLDRERERGLKGKGSYCRRSASAVSVYFIAALDYVALKSLK